MSHPGWDHVAGRGVTARPPTDAAPVAGSSRLAPWRVSAVAPPASHDLVRELAIELFEQAGGESVRVIETLAAVLVNRLRDGIGRAPHSAASPRVVASPRPAPMPERVRPRRPEARLPRELARCFEICGRIARRGLGGTLPDPTDGATAFHRLGEHPAWASDLLPVAEAGPLLFYRP